MKKKKKKRSKKKINLKKIFGFLFFLFILGTFVYCVFNVNIKNIYVKGNIYLSDQEIIDIAEIENYPNSMNNLSYKIKSKLESNTYINKAVVMRRGILLNKVYISVKENYPLFYYLSDNKTVLYDGTKVDDMYTLPTVINFIPNTIYDEFLDKMRNINIDILSRVSEIEYNPNDVDIKRFFLLMNDGNYVYITLNKFLNLNKYVDVMKSIKNKKGILYLDSGEYFEVFDK